MHNSCHDPLDVIASWYGGRHFLKYIFLCLVGKNLWKNFSSYENKVLKNAKMTSLIKVCKNKLYK